MHDQMELVHRDVEELPVPRDAAHEQALQRGRRRAERLKSGERHDVEASDRAVLEPGAQVVREGLHFRELRHGPSVPLSGSNRFHRLPLADPQGIMAPCRIGRAEPGRCSSTRAATGGPSG